MNKLLAVAILGCALTSCATVSPMAIEKDTTKIDTTTKSIVLMTIDVFRTDNSRFVLKPLVVKFVDSKGEGQNFKLFDNAVTRNIDSVEEGNHSIALARMALEPGHYKLNSISGNASAFPFNSLYDVPLVLDLNVKPNAITYVGRVSAHLRRRQEGEFRAGPVVPLVDQAATGISGGTFDVLVSDQSKKDIRVE